MDLILGISLWMRADTDYNNNGDMTDLIFVVLFGIISLVYPVASLIFLRKNHTRFYDAYVRDKTHFERALGELIND